MCRVFWVFRMFLCVCGQCNRTDVKWNQKTRVGERRETTLGGVAERECTDRYSVHEETEYEAALANSEEAEPSNVREC